MIDRMKIYCLGIDWRLGNRDYGSWPPVEFAHFSAVGRWTDGVTCETCGDHDCLRIPPLQVQWESSSHRIADFSYNGLYEYTFIVQDHVASFLKQQGFECQLYPVEYIPPQSKGKQRLVPYPYTGPLQYWVRCETFIELDMTLSQVAMLKPRCAVCGQDDFTFRYDGIVIRESDWNGEKMFRIRTNGKSDATYVTQEGLDLLLSQNYSNLLYREAGRIVA